MKKESIVKTLVVAVLLMGGANSANAQFGRLINKAKKAAQEKVEEEVKNTAESALGEVTNENTASQENVDANSASDAPLSEDTGRKDVADKRKAFLKLYKEQDAGIRASACVSCNACLSKCPQHISIPQHMQRIKELVERI